jgi:hypothetical protein
MYPEAIPYFGGHCGSVDISQRLPAMDVEIVHYQMNDLGCRVCQRQRDRYLSELKTRTIRRREREMTASFRLYCAEILAVPQRSYSLSGLASRPRSGRRGGTNIGVQGNRLLVQADHRFLRVVWLFVRL